jgi:hypothetical protein
MTVGQIAIAFKACGKYFASDFETLESLEKTDDSVTKLFFSALGVDFYEFKKATDILQKMYSLSHIDILNIIDYVKVQNLDTCDFIGGYYEDIVDSYIYEMLEDIFEKSEIEFEQDYDKKAYINGKIPFTFEGGQDFIEAIKDSGFAPLIKIIKASAPHLDFSDKA